MMAIKYLIFAVLLTVSDTQKRLVLHSDQDIDKVLGDMRQEISATKQENLALKTQMAQENLALKNQMAQDNLAMKAEMAREIQALQNNMTLEKQALESQMLQENLALKAQMAQENQALNAQLVKLQKGKYLNLSNCKTHIFKNAFVVHRRHNCVFLFVCFLSSFVSSEIQGVPKKLYPTSVSPKSKST